MKYKPAEKYFVGDKIRIMLKDDKINPKTEKLYLHLFSVSVVPIANPITLPKGEVIFEILIINVFKDLTPN